jgi:hypothetical protein
MERERQEVRRLVALGADVEGGLDDEVPSVAWELWKDRLTPSVFRSFAEQSYNPDSAYARELGTRAGRFVSTLLPLASSPDKFVRENATALVGYALAEDQAGTVRLSPEDRGVLMLAYALAEDEKGAVRVTPDERRWSTQVTARAAEDRHPAIRLAVVNAAKLAGGAWAVPILEQMYEREASFDPSGKNRQSTEAFRGNVKAAIQSIQSRTGK